MKQTQFVITLIVGTFVAWHTSAHDAGHENLFKGGRNGDVLNWANAVSSVQKVDDVLEISTGQVLKLGGFQTDGVLSIKTPDDVVFDQMEVKAGFTTSPQAAVWIGSDCGNFGEVFEVVFTPSDSSIEPQRLRMQKHELNTDGTLASPWPKGTSCTDED